MMSPTKCPFLILNIYSLINLGLFCWEKPTRLQRIGIGIYHVMRIPDFGHLRHAMTQDFLTTAQLTRVIGAQSFK